MGLAALRQPSLLLIGVVRLLELCQKLRIVHDVAQAQIARQSPALELIQLEFRYDRQSDSICKQPCV